VNQADAVRIGRYQILTLLGEGGMARVYLAVQRGPAGFNKLVVVKQVRPELAWDQDFVTMFFDEARIAARLNHPNVVSTFEVVEQAGQYLLAMEYLEGHTLGEILHRLGRPQMPLEQHLWILTQVLAGLHYGHELRDYDGTPLGVVHRDVSPSNVFVTYNGEVKLLDFGIAKSAGAASATQKGTVKGKIGYGAPEQFLARPVDARADVYAVGVMLWEALAGKRRKQAETPAAAYEARVAGLEPRIREVKAEVPERLADICDKATEVEPGARFATALQFQRALEHYLESRPRPIGQRDLATLINYHFKIERQEMRRRIESQLSGSLTPGARELGPMSSVTGLTPVTLSESAPAPEAAHPPSVSTPSAPRAPVRVGPRSLIAAAVTLAAGSVVAAALYVNRDRPAPIGPVSSPPGAAPAGTRAVAAPAPRLPAPERPRTVKLTIEVQPAGATVTLDGKVLSGNPFRGEVPHELRTHLVQASAPGFATAERLITYADDTHLAIALVEKSASRRSRRARREAPAPEAPASEVRRVEPRRIEPGMELRRAASSTPRRHIDEKDPYAP
jgi:serine/threonine-protein kinase